MRRKRVFKLWALIGNDGRIATDPNNHPTPYVWGNRRECEMCADGIPGVDADRVQRVKLTIEPIGPAREPRW